MSVPVWLSLGSNLGDRLAMLHFAAEKLDSHPAITVEARSPVYQTAPWGGVNQPDYYNAVLRVCTTLEPEQLLDVCLAIEQLAGRTRDVRWGARTLDIDLLLYADLQYNSERLTLPHPYLAKRRFVLEPLVAVAGGETLPLVGSVQQLLEECIDELPVTQIKTDFAFYRQERS